MKEIARKTSKSTSLQCLILYRSWRQRLPYLNEVNETKKSIYRGKVMQGKQSIFPENSAKDLLLRGKGAFRKRELFI